jgi:hypothetical protein
VNPDDYIAAARLVRKYATAVETTLYWKMTTRAAKEEVLEATRLAELLEDEAAKEDTEVSPIQNALRSRL